ncbi:unnamed protein product [Bathycoccus prasinos]
MHRINQFIMQMELIHLTAGSATNILQPSSSKSDVEIQSQFGRFNYDFDDKYLLTATIRRDGASNFSANEKYALFPSAALGWKVSNENFLKDSKAISNLKFRASYGVTGNPSIGAYESLSRLETLYASSNGQTVSAVTPEQPENPNLKWESSYQTNFGIDLGLINNRVSVSLDYYNIDTKDLILTDNSITEYLGFSGDDILANVGEINNRGLEIALSTKNILKEDFRWTTDFNIAFNKNEVVSLVNDADLFFDATPSYFSHDRSYVLRVGEEVGLFWGYEYAGVYQGGTAPADPEVSYYGSGGNNNTSSNTAQGFDFGNYPTFWGRKLSIALMLRSDMVSLASNETRRVEMNEFTTLASNAQAYFARAFYYFHLVRLFGDVPYIDAPVTDFDAATSISRTPAAEVYENIISDLEYAKTWLPATVTSRATSSKAAASSYLALVYLTLEQWQNSFDEAQEVIDNAGTYNLALESNFQNLFNADAIDASLEPIFALDYNNFEADDNAYDQTAPMTGIRGDDRNLGGGWSVAVPTLEVYTTWDAGDYRRAVSMDDEVSIGGTVTIDDILEERRLEFAFEGIRCRGNVRESIQKLEFYGILKSKPQSGTFVADIGQVAMNEMGKDLGMDESDYGIMLSIFMGTYAIGKFLSGLGEAGWMPLYLNSEFGFSVEEIGSTIWISYLGGMAGSIIGGWYSGKLMETKSVDAARKITITIGGVLISPRSYSESFS